MVQSTQLTDLHLAVLVVRRWRWIAWITSGSIVAAGALALLTTPVYRAETVLVHVERYDGSVAAGSALGALGGLGALVGLGERNGAEVEAISLLKSRQFTQDFIRERNLMPRLFHRKWDARAGKWDSRISRPPTLWDGYKFFDRKVRRIEEDRRTGVVTLQIDWEDPEEAADWANDLVRRVNAQMKARALREAALAVAYLTSERQKTDIASVQQSIDKLIESNLKRQVLASVQDEYVFSVVDPAAPPDKKDKLKPHAGIYLLTGAFFGLLLSLLVIVSHQALSYLGRLVRAGQ